MAEQVIEAEGRIVEVDGHLLQPGIKVQKKIVEIDPEEPWQMIPGESPIWHERFFTYLMMGATRSVLQIHLQYSGNPRTINTYYERAKYWRWRERAQAYDAHMRKKELEVAEQVRLRSKKDRIEMLDAVRERFMDKLDDLDNDKLSWKTAPAVMKTVVQELRNEHEGRVEQQQTAIEVTASTAIESLRVRLLQMRGNLRHREMIEAGHHVLPEEEAPEAIASD